MAKRIGRFHGSHIVRAIAALTLVGLVWYFFNTDSSMSVSAPMAGRLRDTVEPVSNVEKSSSGVSQEDKMKAIDDATIMPLMEDKQAKVELGRASWKYFHTLLARFPDKPNKEERQKLKTFLELYAELYPCGECAYHFVKLMDKYPPQTSSRTAAALWGCHVHNIVNEYLKKPEYDCSTILEDYDCGCGDTSVKNNKVTVEKEGRQHG